MVTKPKKLIFSIGIIVFLLIMSLTSGVSINIGEVDTNIVIVEGFENPVLPLNGNTLYVGCLGPGCYDSIQEAIDAANDGDTVYVYDDFAPYYENVIVNKSINLIGENRDTTIIDGSGTEDVVYISADQVNITNFTIRNSGDIYNPPQYDAGIEIRSNNNSIYHNNVVNNGRGIWVAGLSNNTIFENMISDNNGTGIRVKSSDNEFTNNIIMNNDGDGIYLSHLAKHNTISENTITNNTIGIHIYAFCYNNLIYDNIISYNRQHGYYSGDSTSNDNDIYYNFFINNTENVFDHSHYGNNWDDGYPNGGNFWSDYTGVDELCGPGQNITYCPDGIGDTPYYFPTGDHQDRYPLMIGTPLLVNAKGPYFGYIHIPLQFNGWASGGNPPYSWHWDFGDGNTSDDHNPVHIYSAVGNYEVTLTVTDADSNSTINRSNASIKILYAWVDDDYNSQTSGWQIDHFDNIQDGIDVIEEGGTVYVANGTYYENIDVNKSINLIGEDRNTTVIDGNGSGIVVIISTEEVTLSGLTVQNGTTGVYDVVSNSLISENIITSHSGSGIRLDNSFHIVTGNTITYCGVGIGTDGFGNTTISDNIITNNWRGISFVEENPGSIRFSTISGNTVANNNDNGIYLWGLSVGDTISGNIIENNDGIGLRVIGMYNIISGNIIENNSGTGLLLSGYNNTAYHNNFINNTPNAYDVDNNLWDDGYSNGGNYWYDHSCNDTYQGLDQDEPGSDGICDMSYEIPCGTSECPSDHYPLALPFPGCSFIRGNADNDDEGNVTMNDAIVILKYLYVPGISPPSCLDATDVDDNGEVTMADALHTLKYLYVPGSPPPPAPYPDCGSDPTQDELGCNLHPCGC